MESVLDTKIQEKNKASRLADGSVSNHMSSQAPFIHPESVQKVQTSHLNLQEAIIKYESIVEHLRTTLG